MQRHSPQSSVRSSNKGSISQHSQKLGAVHRPRCSILLRTCGRRRIAAWAGSQDASSPQAEAVQKANTAILQSLQVDVNSIKSRAPALLTTDLEAWMAFLTSAGFNKEQIRHLFSQGAENLAQATLVSAGNTMLTLRSMEMDMNAVQQLVVYYPQCLHMPPDEVKDLVKLLGRYQSTHGC